MIDFSSNVNPLGCHPGVKRYLKKQLDLISEYPDPNSSDLRANLAWFTGVRKKQIVVGNGATEIIYNFCKTFLNKKTPVLVADYKVNFTARNISALGFKDIRIIPKKGLKLKNSDHIWT